MAVTKIIAAASSPWISCAIRIEAPKTDPATTRGVHLPARRCGRTQRRRRRGSRSTRAPGRPARRGPGRRPPALRRAPAPRPPSTTYTGRECSDRRGGSFLLRLGHDRQPDRLAFSKTGKRSVDLDASRSKRYGDPFAALFVARSHTEARQEVLDARLGSAVLIQVRSDDPAPEARSCRLSRARWNPRER
jgi:hypothetical protein